MGREDCPRNRNNIQRNALEEEKSKSLNLSDLLESERDTLWRLQAELETIKQQQAYNDPRAIEQMQAEMNQERDRRCQAESQHEIDMVTMENVRQELEMSRRHQHALETELGAKVSQLQRTVDMEREKQLELNRALERERSLSMHLQQSLEAEKSNVERNAYRDQSTLDDIQIQLETERANLNDLNRALMREQKAREEADSEKNLIKDHLNQERALNEDLKHDVDKLQFDRLEAVNRLQKEREQVSRLKSERDQVTEDLRKMKSLDIQRNHDREAERLASKKSVRETGREREEYRMKLHEQELETQRLTQKVQGLEDQLAESQENELKAIRELEQLKIETTSPEGEMASAQTSPRPDISDGMSQDFQNGHPESWHVYRSQLESMCQSLHYLVLRCREQLNKISHSGGRQAELVDIDALQRSLRDLLSEVKQLKEMEGDYMTHPASTVNERILRQNEELTNFVARISEEKTELRNTLTRLEEEIWRYRKMDSKYQEMQRVTSGTDHQLIAERSEWAKEKLSLQMALNAAEREIDLLQTDLRVERERRVAAGITETKDTDKIKIQRLYGKYLRAESFRKALIYQKKYLLLLLGGFQDTEETTLALLSRMGAVDSRRQSAYRRKPNPLTSFRGAVRVVIAIQRMKFLVKKWRRATRVGSEVVGGAMDQTNGYVPHSNGYSPPRPGTSPRVSSIPVRSASSSPARPQSFRQPSPTRATDSAMYFSPRFDVDSYSSSSYTSPRITTVSHVPSTPPTKDYSSTTKYTSPSSGARRKILTSASIPAPRSGRVRFTAEENGNGDLGDSDDYINRLENLQSRLGHLQSGRKPGYRQAWR